VLENGSVFVYFINAEPHLTHFEIWVKLWSLTSQKGFLTTLGISFMSK